MAVVSGVTVVPNTRIVGVALTGLYGYKAVAAMGKTLELDGGKRVLREQEGGRAHKSDKQYKLALSHAYVPEFGFATQRRAVDLLCFWQASKLA